MELTFLGLGAAFYPPLLNTCAYWRRAGELYLVDCGATAFAQLHRLGLLEGLTGLTCLVTHRHADHTGSLATLISYAKHVGHFPIRLVHPDGALAQQMSLAGISPQAYTFDPSPCYADGYLEAAFYPVKHTASLPAWGMTLATEGETDYYSGDGEAPPQALWEDFLAGRIRRLYQDAGRRSHAGHGDFDALCRLTPPALRSRVYPIHLDEDYRPLIRQEGFGAAKLAQELLRFNIASAIMDGDMF